MKKEGIAPFSGKMLDLWSWLAEVRICVPMIQRDYAQGRTGKHYIREHLLNSLYGALVPLDNHPVKLDFIYGTESCIKGATPEWTISPLDGQQRLTSLWLLYWYIAVKSGKVRDLEVRDRLSHFSYETRISSAEFCKALVEKSTVIANMADSQETLGIVDVIKRQTWFSIRWMDDPTIMSMLQMLSGDRSLKHCKDGIEKLFGGKSEEIYQHCWEMLTDPENCPVSFYYQSLQGLKDPDTLYIKMNARGKPLTPFENFKAELVDLATRKCAQGEDGDFWKLFPGRLDNDWNDVFWTPPQEEDTNGAMSITGDDSYFAFINRLVFDYIVTSKNEQGSFIQTGNVEGLSDRTRESSNLYHFLEGGCFFDTFSRYEEAFSKAGKRFADVLDCIAKIKNNGYNVDQLVRECAPSWFDRTAWFSRFGFVPRREHFQKESRIVTGIQDAITQPQRVWFLAISRFLEKVEFAREHVGEWKEKFGDWLRVAGNLIENSDINTLPGTIAAMRLIDGLAGICDDILHRLADSETPLNVASSRDQFVEEWEKAKYIVGAGAGLQDRKSEVVQAEGNLFFRGALRFLYHDAMRNVDWGLFSTRCLTLGRLFDTNGRPKDGTIGKFASHWTLDQLLASAYKKIAFNRDAANWKYIFLSMYDSSEILRSQLVDFLDRPDVESTEEPIRILTRGLGKIEQLWGGQGTWRVLTRWSVNGVLHRIVLTDYAQRRDPPSNGLFADLDSPEEDIMVCIEREANRRGLTDTRPVEQQSNLPLGDTSVNGGEELEVNALNAMASFLHHDLTNAERHNTQIEMRRYNSGETFFLRFTKNKPHVTFNLWVSDKESFAARHGDILRGWGELNQLGVTLGRDHSQGNGIQFKPKSPINVANLDCVGLKRICDLILVKLSEILGGNEIEPDKGT